MSGDLISRKETERILRSYADDVGCNRGEYVLANGILKAVSRVTDHEIVPTAYNLDKVIEQLEENEQEMTSQLEKSAKNAPNAVQETNLKLTAQLFRDYTKSQIKIVKSGGVAND